MKKILALGLLILLLLLLSGAARLASAYALGGYTLPWWTADGGGGSSSGTGYQLSVTVDTAEIVYMDMREQLRIPVDLLPLDEAWKLIEQRLALFTTGSLPDVLHDSDETWECDYCPVRGVCERLYGAPVGKSLFGEEAA